MNMDYVSIGRNPPEEVNAIIEVPIGGEPIKYEMDKKAGTLVVDRFLYTPMRYPGDYGFIPHTLSEDGDPCDILVANTRPIIPGAVVAVRPIGVLKMTDEGGGDEKIVAVPIPKLTQRYAHVINYTDLPEITWRQIEHFFAHYKDLEGGKWVRFAGWGDANEAKRLITQAIDRSKGQGAKRGRFFSSLRQPDRSKELMLAIWTAAHSGELLRAFHFAGPCVRMAMRV